MDLWLADLSEHMNYDQGLILSRRNDSFSLSCGFKSAGEQSFLSRLSDSYRWVKLDFILMWGFWIGILGYDFTKDYKSTDHMAFFFIQSFQ